MIYKKLLTARSLLSQKDFKTKHENKFAKYKYSNLTDVNNDITDACEKVGILPIFKYGACECSLHLIDVDEPSSTLDFKLQNVKFKKLERMSELQSVGAYHSYMKKYLYFNAFDIAVDTEKSIDSLKSA